MGSVLQGFGGGGVGTEFRVEVTEDSDANGVTHVVIVLERVGVVGGLRLEVWCAVGCLVLPALELRLVEAYVILVRVVVMDAESRFLWSLRDLRNDKIYRNDKTYRNDMTCRNDETCRDDEDYRRVL